MAITFTGFMGPFLSDVISLAGVIPAGSQVVIAFTVNHPDAPLPLTPIDSKGNVYTVLASAVGTGALTFDVATAIVIGNITTQLIAGDQIDLQYGGVASFMVIGAHIFTGLKTTAESFGSDEDQTVIGTDIPMCSVPLSLSGERLLVGVGMAWQQLGGGLSFDLLSSPDLGSDLVSIYGVNLFPPLASSFHFAKTAIIAIPDITVTFEADNPVGFSSCSSLLLVCIIPGTAGGGVDLAEGPGGVLYRTWIRD